MIEYHKIETLFERDTNGTKKLIEGTFRNDAVKYLANNDGMGIKLSSLVELTGHKFLSFLWII